MLLCVVLFQETSMGISCLSWRTGWYSMSLKTCGTFSIFCVVSEDTLLSDSVRTYVTIPKTRWSNDYINPNA